MAPFVSKKRKPDEADITPDEFPTTDNAVVTTPIGSPARKKMKITQTQKQALIDNLQLESTKTRLYSMSLSLTRWQSLNVPENCAPTTPFKPKISGLELNDVSTAYHCLSAKPGWENCSPDTWVLHILGRLLLLPRLLQWVQRLQRV